MNNFILLVSVSFYCIYACQKIEIKPILIAKYVENEYFRGYQEDTSLFIFGSQKNMDNFFQFSFFEQISINYQNDKVVKYCADRYFVNTPALSLCFQKTVDTDSLTLLLENLDPQFCYPIALPPPQSRIQKDTVILANPILRQQALHITYYSCHEMLSLWWEEKIGILSYRGKDWALLLDKIYIIGEKTDSICLQPLHFAFAKQQQTKK